MSGDLCHGAGPVLWHRFKKAHGHWILACSDIRSSERLDLFTPSVWWTTAKKASTPFRVPPIDNTLNKWYSRLASQHDNTVNPFWTPCLSNIPWASVQQSTIRTTIHFIGWEKVHVTIFLTKINIIPSFQQARGLLEGSILDFEVRFTWLMLLIGAELLLPLKRDSRRGQIVTLSGCHSALVWLQWIFQISRVCQR